MICYSTTNKKKYITVIKNANNSKLRVKTFIRVQLIENKRLKFKLMTYLGFSHALKRERVTAAILINQICFDQRSNVFLLRDHAVKAFDFDQ